jgi:hypothetical protein
MDLETVLRVIKPIKKKIKRILKNSFNYYIKRQNESDTIFIDSLLRIGNKKGLELIKL